MFTNFTFSGESVCGDQLCEKLFEIFADPSASKVFELNIPNPNNITSHQNVKKHINPGTTQEEIKKRHHKSMFDLHYKNRATLHRIITKATEPVNSGKVPLSRYLCHSINIADSKDNWSFNFKHPGFPKEHQRTFGVGQVKLPGEAVYRQKEILMFFYIMQFTGMYPDGYITNAVNTSELSTLFATRNTSKTSTRGKNTTYESKQATTHTTQTKQTLTLRSKTGYARRKNENPVTTQPVKTHQEHPGNKQLITSHNNSRETEHLKDRKKQVQVKKMKTVNRTEPQAENKKNGKKKKKKRRL